MKTGKRRNGSIARRLRYRFDLALSRGPLVVIGYLGLIMLAIILVAASIDTAFRITGINGETQKPGFAEAFWQSILRVLDTGTFANDAHWPARVVGLFVTLCGIFLAGSLIGLIATGLDQQVDNLRKGRSFVLEEDHTVVLGWSPRLPVILSELVIANANRRHAAVVILADRPKDDMEDELRRLAPNTGNTRVVCRTGDPGSPADLHLVNITAARSVIVLAGEDGDAGVVKAVLAVRSIDPEFSSVRLVAELDDRSHAETLRALTDGRIATVRAEDVISQVTAQACHQSGLAGVFRDLLDFDGDEIYFATVPELAGHTYGEALTAFDTSAVIGLCRAGDVLLNPPAEEVFRPGDEVIAVAADDDAIIFTGFVTEQATHAAPATPFVEPPQRIAVIGWSPLGAAVLSELDQLLGDGSSVDLVVDRARLTESELLLPPLRRCTVQVHWLGAGPAALLAAIGTASYDQAIVLGYRRGLTAAQADARSMLTLLALHKAWSHRPSRPRLVAEMLDRADVDIALTTGVDDFIVSDELSSLMIAQLSERLELQHVFSEIFDAEGCFVSLRPAPLYVPVGPTTFGAIVAAAAARGESALGYRLSRQDVVLNPPKSAAVELDLDASVLVLGRRPTSSLPGRELHVAAEGLTHGGEQLVGVHGLAAAGEPREERR